MTREFDTEQLELELLLEGIQARYGYDLREYSMSSLRRRIQNARSELGFEHLGELQHRALHDPSVFARIMASVSVQVSDMFRDPSFFKIFRETVLPHLRTYPQIKLWIAGCAGGEEVYSMAILLQEAELYDRCQIYATDLSAEALHRAREGVYPKARGRVFAENYREAGGTRSFEHYCAEAYGHIALADSLKKNMFFFQHNLVSDHSPGEMQVILCRNVLIYFNPTLRDRVLLKLSEGLCHGGFLALGTSESLPDALLSTRFQKFQDKERVYRHWGIE